MSRLWALAILDIVQVAMPKCSNFVKPVLLGVALLCLGGSALAQPPRPCEERLAEFRVYADLVASGRTKSEVEAAQGIAALRRENDLLRAELGRLAEELKSARGQKQGK